MCQPRKAFLSLLAVVFLCLGAVQPAQAGRPLTFNDMISFGRVSDPQISPDGQWVVYVVDTYDKGTNARRSDLWLASLQTGESRQLTRSGKRDRQPRWSPDSKTLGFLSNREGGWEIWTIRRDGGEATRLTQLPVDAAELLWSPDGSWLAFTAEVYPDCYDAAKAEAVLECTEKRDQEKEKSLVKARLYDRLLYRHWDTWWEGKHSHVFVLPAAGGTPRDLTPGEASVPPYLGGAHEFDFSPDGSELAFARNVDKNAAWSTNSDVWVVSVRGGEPKRITENPAWDGSPRYSPDGRWIAYRAMARAGFEADRTRLVLYERATGRTQQLTPDFDNSMGDFVWAADSSNLPGSCTRRQPASRGGGHQ
jgi:Tol biopolymer transport system component